MIEQMMVKSDKKLLELALRIEEEEDSNLIYVVEGFRDELGGEEEAQ